MIANRKEFYSGVAMMAAFLVVLGLFFAPLFNGQNGLAYLDNLYNSISKGSANYLEMVGEAAESTRGTRVEVTLTAADAQQAASMATLLESAGADASATDVTVAVSGDLGAILTAAAMDTADMYHNNGQAVTERRDVADRLALYTWWSLLGSLEKQLNKKELFAEAKQVSVVISRGVETAYNYYGVEAQSIMDRIGVVIFSLVFYVVYTMWYGFAILFMFEGWGLRLEH